uniref:mitogen-activated protein kinase kinase n=1 Tax=Ditylenchus dipsaci TaxID=166011 RepID=A0A915EQB6_9BILA
MSVLLKGETLVLHDDSKVKAEEFLDNKIVALYFSAGWCPPCRNFTPKLKKFYDAVKAAGKNFEFGNPLIQEYLAKYEVKTIPSLKVIKPDGSVVVSDARNEIVEKGGENPVQLFEEWESFYDFLYVKATFATVSLESQLGKLRNRWTNKTASSLRLSDFRRYKSNKYILGKGAYGVVELVLATKYPYRSAKVAMKVIKMPQEGQSNNSRLSILAEISILTKIKSRYTVNMFAFDWDNSNVYIMLSYAAGGSFNDLYQYVKSTSLKKALEEGDVKDLKPHNVLVTSDGHLQLADFGMSRILKNGDEKGNIRCGTPRYTAPEAIGYDKEKRSLFSCTKRGCRSHGLVCHWNNCL